jgi:hypothetical protein
MSRSISRALAAAAVALAAAPTFAEGVASSASSTASSAGSSASNSLEASSGSSSKGNTAAAGDYQVEAVTVAADRPGMVRVALAPAAEDRTRNAFVLVLPQATAQQQGLARGDTVSVRERAYGFEFARADTRQAFYLVLADAWQRELDARPVDAAARAL